MPKQTRLAMLGIAALTMLALPAAAQKQADPQAAAKKKLYCWNQNGQRICSDTLPADAINQARDEFSARSGTRSAEVGRAMSAEERAAAAAEQAQRQADQAAEETRKRTDQAMLLSFQSEDELRRVFTERTNIIENNVHTARYNVTSLREGLVTLLRAAGDRDLGGQKISDKMAADIQQRHRELLWQQRLQANFEQQRVDLEVEIEQILQRFRAVKGTPATAG
jgi:hypothetical protein